MISNPTVRSMGLEILEYSALPSHGASLLEANFEEGDLKILSGAFRKARSEHERHGIAMSIREIDKRFSPAGASSVLLMLYEHVRCGVCRKQTVERLHAHGSLPASIANECRFDAYLPLRQTIAELVPDPAAQH